MLGFTLPQKAQALLHFRQADHH